jgi:hypothetical protein
VWDWQSGLMLLRLVVGVPQQHQSVRYKPDGVNSINHNETPNCETVNAWSCRNCINKMKLEITVYINC